jgi:hypothetical protein
MQETLGRDILTCPEKADLPWTEELEAEKCDSSDPEISWIDATLGPNPNCNLFGGPLRQRVYCPRHDQDQDKDRRDLAEGSAPHC